MTTPYHLRVRTSIINALIYHTFRLPALPYMLAHDLSTVLNLDLDADTAIFNEIANHNDFMLRHDNPIDAQHMFAPNYPHYFNFVLVIDLRSNAIYWTMIPHN